MSVRSERIKALIEQSKQSYQELEKTTGIKKSSLQRYASGVTTKIPLDVIEKLSKAFNVSQEYLMGWDETKKNSPNELQLTEGEKVWLELYSKITPDTRTILINIAEAFESFPDDKQRLVLDMIQVALRNQK